MIPSRVSLLQLEALTVGALFLGGIGLMGTHLDCAQTAIVGILAMMGTVIHSTLDALVGGAGLAAIGVILVHKKILLRAKCWLSP